MKKMEAQTEPTTKQKITSWILQNVLSDCSLGTPTVFIRGIPSPIKFTECAVMIMMAYNRTAREKVNLSPRFKKLIQDMIIREEVLQVSARDYMPFKYGSDDSTPETFINTFEGWGCKPQKGNFPYIQQLLSNLCSGNEAQRNYLEKWLAHIVQFPEIKSSVVPVFNGGQGHGKGTLFKILRMMLGTNYTTINRDTILGNFNSTIANRLLVVADEVVNSQDHRYINTLKDWSGSSHLTINAKYERERIQFTPFRLILATNDDWAAPIEENNRRYLILKTTMPQDPDFFLKVHKEIDEGGVEFFFEHLLSLDLSDFNPQAFPRELISEGSKENLYETLTYSNPVKAWLLACKNPETFDVGDEENILLSSITEIATSDAKAKFLKWATTVLGMTEQAALKCSRSFTKVLTKCGAGLTYKSEYRDTKRQRYGLLVDLDKVQV